jgi:hypothetical protein
MQLENAFPHSCPYLVTTPSHYLNYYVYTYLPYMYIYAMTLYALAYLTFHMLCGLPCTLFCCNIWTYMCIYLLYIYLPCLLLTLLLYIPLYHHAITALCLYMYVCHCPSCYAMLLNSIPLRAPGACPTAFAFLLPGRNLEHRTLKLYVFCLLTCTCLCAVCLGILWVLSHTTEVLPCRGLLPPPIT